MMPLLDVRLLGGFTVKLNDAPLHAFRSAKARALFAFLAVEADRAHSRSALATLLWGELPDAAALTNLRIELSNLKRLCADHPALEITRATVTFHRRHATVDLHALRDGVAAFLAQPAENQATTLPRLEAALALYAGDFLVGLHLDDAEEFETWLTFTRAQTHAQAMTGLETLQQHYAQQARWGELAAAARRQLALAPWVETAHRSLIQALAAQGQVQAALAQFAQCQAILQREFGVEPSRATQELAARLHADAPARPRPRHNLPPPTQHFLGRAAEVADVHALLLRARLVTLVGLGGVGKSRLALAVAQRSLTDFPGGVWFVPLANLEAGRDAAGRIALAIAAVIGHALTNLQDPLAELIQHLAEARLLLVLDTWDHLVDSAPEVLEPLLSHTAVHVLATSRLRLRLEDETPVPVAGLSAAAAFELFVDRARRVLPEFRVEEGEAAAIAALCRQVAGLPLGIELAAGWVEHFRVDEIGHALAAREVAPDTADELAGRHHGLRRVFDHSWQLLGPRLQTILAQLSLFRSGIDRDAATAVTAGSLGDLSNLLAFSLLQRVRAGRYDLHPLIQELAAEKLAHTDQGALAARHSHYYLSTLAATPRAQWRDTQQVEFENIRRAWEAALAARDARLVAATATAFAEYMAQFGLLPDGERLLAAAVAAFAPDPAEQELVARLLEAQSHFTHPLHGLKAAGDLLHRLLPLTQDRALQIKAHSQLAFYYAEIGAWHDADAQFEQIRGVAAAADDLGMVIRAEENRIRVNALHFRGDFAAGIARLEEMLGWLDCAAPPPADAEEIRTWLLSTLTGVTMRYGDYAAAIRYCQQNLARLSTLGRQRERVQMLSGLALAEQYAGLFAEAIIHHHAALTLAEEVRDLEDIAIIQVNLCLTTRALGELETALAHGQTAVDLITCLGHPRLEGQARNRVGHALLALERWAEADAAYADALAVWDTLAHPNRYEAVAGRAVAAWRLGQAEAAQAAVAAVLAFVAAEGLVGVVEPARLLLNCATVLAALGEPTAALAALRQAAAWIDTIAARISDPAVRAAFYDRPDNQRVRHLLAERVPLA